MATRSGTVDPGLLLELMREGYSTDHLATMLQKESGLQALSGFSSDMREIREAAGQGHNGAIRALEVFRHRLLQLLGSMAASLGGVDVLALTGGIGEHDKDLYEELASALHWWGDVSISVIPADEEGMIARLCRRHSSSRASAPIG
jgi:acetate kinase